MIIPEGFGQVNYIFGGLNAPTGAQVTLGFAHALYAGTITECADDFREVWEDNVLPQQSVDLILASVLVKWGPNDDGPSVIVPSGAPGLSGDTTSPPQVSYLVRKITAMGGRRHRGRFFLPGVAESSVNDSGTVDASKVIAIDAGLDTMKTALEAVNLPLYVLHNGVTAPTLIEELRCQTTVATQRRRLRR